MNFKNMFAVAAIVLTLTMGAFAQETLNASDLVSQITSAMDLDFSQEDRIKPIVEEYVSGINRIEGQGETNEKSLRPQIRQLNQQFDQKLSQVFTPDQLNTWKTAKRQILPNAGEGKEGREANEAGEANEHGGG